MFCLNVIATIDVFSSFLNIQAISKRKTAKTLPQYTRIYRIHTFTLHQAPMNFRNPKQCLLRLETSSHGRKHKWQRLQEVNHWLPLLIRVQKFPSLLPRADIYNIVTVMSL